MVSDKLSPRRAPHLSVISLLPANVNTRTRRSALPLAGRPAAHLSPLHFLHPTVFLRLLEIVSYIITALVAYLLGSIPTGYLVGRSLFWIKNNPLPDRVNISHARGS